MRPWEIREGDALELLRAMPDASVHCCVTSPPYWGLRDYGTGDGQIGLESTPGEYVARLVDVFREVRRVLRDDGTLWLNLGDSYATGAGKVGERPGGGAQGDAWADVNQDPKRRAPRPRGPMTQPNRMPIPGLKPKDLVGIPWRVALALQADGWWLRSDIIWSKPNPMPESVQDRPTKAHEYLFLLAKGERYHYDLEAIAEPAGYAHEAHLDNGLNGHGGGVSHAGQGSTTRKFRSGNKRRKRRGDHGGVDGHRSNQGFGVPWEGVVRNRRTVWTITTKPYPGAHFATFPPELPELCIRAGCPEGGTVLDPFAGAGTTGLVALRHGRGFIGLELNPEYADMARRRIHNGSGRLPADNWHPTHDDLPLFGEARP